MLSPSKSPECLATPIATEEHLSCSSPNSPPTHSNHNPDPPEPLNEEASKLFGIDSMMYCYKEDEQNGFEMEDGRQLEGDELVEHLIRCNRKLVDKAELYRKNTRRQKAKSGMKSTNSRGKLKESDIFIGT